LPLAVGPAISQMRPVMQIVLTLASPDGSLNRTAGGKIAEALAGAGFDVKAPVMLGHGAADLPFEGDNLDRAKAIVAPIIDGFPIDWCVQPAEGRRKRLLVADMDSTIINVECLDELADYAGLKAEIAEITERAMRGELEFEGALRERVGKLKGLATTALQQAYDERVHLNPGARTLVRTMAADGARCALVSGGFTFFTERVAQAAGFHLNKANTLHEAEGALLGTVGEPILGKAAKLAALKDEAAALGIDLSQTLAIGDGANDLAMIKASGLGIAYRAKPVVAAEAHAKIDHADLTAALYFQGYTSDEFVID
jgi:phosphoserine phosphatase